MDPVAVGAKAARNATNSPGGVRRLGTLGAQADPARRSTRLEDGNHAKLGAGAPDSWLLYVQFLVQTRKLEEAKSAVQTAKRALAGKGSNVILAECCMMVGENREAEALIQGSFKERPDDPQTLRVAAGFYLAMGKTDEVGKYLDLLMAPAPGATPEDLLWASRTRAKALLRTGQAADRDRALALVEDNLKGKSDSTASLEDQTLKARIMATRAKTTEDAIKILKPLDDAGRLGPDEQFLLAQLYLNGRNDKDFQDVMLKILVPNKTQTPNPHYISTYINFLISRGELVQADRWLADLKKIEPKGLATLEQQASLIKARNPGRPDPPGIRDMLEAYGKENPDQIYGVAILLNRYGFFKEAEQAYRAYIERDRGKPERELALAGFLASRRDEVRTSDAMAILTRAWKTCAPEQVAFTALALYDAPSVSEAQRMQIESWLVEATQKRPDLVVLSNKLAAIWIRQGRFDEAKVMYERLIGSNPDNAEALNNLAWLLALRGQDGSQDPLKLIDRAIDIQGKIPSLLDTRAVVLIRANKLDEAIETLNDAQNLDKRNISVPLHMVAGASRQGQDRRGSGLVPESRRPGLETGQE